MKYLKEIIIQKMIKITYINSSGERVQYKEDKCQKN